MYSRAHWGTVEDRSCQGPSHDTWLEKKNKWKWEQLLLFSAELHSEQGMKFVYILVGFTRECLNRQTAAGLPSQQLINISLPHWGEKGRHDLLFANSQKWSWSNLSKRFNFYSIYFSKSNFSWWQVKSTIMFFSVILYQHRALMCILCQNTGLSIITVG